MPIHFTLFDNIVSLMLPGIFLLWAIKHCHYAMHIPKGQWLVSAWAHFLGACLAILLALVLLLLRLSYVPRKPYMPPALEYQHLNAKPYDLGNPLTTELYHAIPASRPTR